MAASAARWISVFDYLAELASEGTVPLTYGTLAVTLRHFQGTPAHRRHLAGMLLKVHERCVTDGEPDLTAFVVNKGTEEPSKGYLGGTPEVERQKAHDLWRKRRWGK